MKDQFCFLTIGKTHESTETQESKRYIGIGSSYVLAVNPTKKELEDIYGHEQANEPTYIQENAEVPTIRIDFIVKTDPEQCNGIETTNKLSFFLSNEGSYNRDKTKMQVIDDYGNSTWAPVEDVKMNKIIIQSNGREAKIAHKYRPAFRGEADLVDFLKSYFNIEDVFNYVDGSWVMKTENLEDYAFSLEHIKDYFKGDVSELKEAISLMPKNKVKLLYGIRTTDKGQFQTICTRNGMILRNNVTSRGLERLEKSLTNARLAGAFANTEFKVCPLQEYNIEATNLENTTVEEDSTSEMPWD